MNTTEAHKRIVKLRDQIEELRYRYHVLDDPTVTDEVYDSLTRELKALEAEFPQFVDPSTSINRVGGKPLEKFVKVKPLMAKLGPVKKQGELVGQAPALPQPIRSLPLTRSMTVGLRLLSA